MSVMKSGKADPGGLQEECALGLLENQALLLLELPSAVQVYRRTRLCDHSSPACSFAPSLISETLF